MPKDLYWNRTSNRSRRNILVALYAYADICVVITEFYIWASLSYPFFVFSNYRRFACVPEEHLACILLNLFRQ
jgi:hypothetical protein